MQEELEDMKESIEQLFAMVDESDMNVPLKDRLDQHIFILYDMIITLLERYSVSNDSDSDNADDPMGC